MVLTCPICMEPLEKFSGQYRCPRGHCFDIARQGYVNLLSVSQKHSLHPGDTRVQVAARREFLEGGFYAPIAQALVDAAWERQVTGPLLDVGCGEGYYAARLGRALGLEFTGLDISKDAVRCAAGKYKDGQWLCATASHIPVPAASAGLLTSLFALTLPAEFRRVLVPGGWFFQVLAGEDHLLNLKSVIYPRLERRRKDTAPEVPGFTREGSVPIRFSFTLRDRQVQNLLAMTPHYYRISKEGAERLKQVTTLTDTASCVLNLYRRD